MTSIGSNRNQPSSKITSEADQKKKEIESVDDTDIVKIPVTDGADAIYVENGTAVLLCRFNVSKHDQVNSLVKIEQVGTWKGRYAILACLI